VCGKSNEDSSLINKASVIAVSDLLIAKNKVPTNYIFGSYLGLDYSDTTVTDKEIDITVKYNIPVPVGRGIWGIKYWKMFSRSKSNRWVGYDPKEDQSDNDRYVYITEHGKAYHNSVSCSYLSPSIKAAYPGDINFLRNNDRKIYYKCKLCGKESGILYYTDYGTSYHSSLTCPGLKRTVFRKKFSEIEGKYRPCIKCVSP
ncbi:MAG: hypothetical protein K6F00_03685, partial [Lachnospiraceae bacterium]|nr:hypothetical protein [Lachnospiraceae bacterium]